MTDQFSAWRHALKGNPMDCGPHGKPSSGYFMQATPNGREAVGIYLNHDVPGEYLVWRTLTLMNPTRMNGEEADEILVSVSRYPISYEQFCRVAIDKEPWPPEYDTRLTNREILLGVCWTPELGRRKLEEQWQKLERTPKWAAPKSPL